MQVSFALHPKVAVISIHTFAMKYLENVYFCSVDNFTNMSKILLKNQMMYRRGISNLKYGKT